MRREGPGPGKYVLPPTLGCKTHDPRKTRNPCYTIGKRTNEIYDSVGPGPAKYVPDKINRYGREHFSAYIGNILHEPQGEHKPAPNAYSLPTPNVCTRRPPVHSIGIRLGQKVDTGIPGPNVYKLPKTLGPGTGPVTSTPKAPVFSIGKRLDTNINSGTPGPKYLLKFSEYGKLLPTLKHRTMKYPDNGVPGPKYDLKYHKPGRRSPAFSLGIRYPEWVEPHIIPEDY